MLRSLPLTCATLLCLGCTTVTAPGAPQDVGGAFVLVDSGSVDDPGAPEDDAGVLARVDPGATPPLDGGGALAKRGSGRPGKQLAVRG